MAKKPITVLSKEQSILGTDWYRDGSVDAPNAYKPTIQHKVSANATGSNHNISIRSDDYVVTADLGVTRSVDRFIMTTKFNSLQEVSAVVERARIYDTHIAYLLATRADTLNGNLPDNALVTLPDMAAVLLAAK